MNMELERRGYYGLLLPDSPEVSGSLVNLSQSHSALMDAAADEGKAALTPFKRTLPSRLHLHLKGQFTQITQHLAAALSARGEFRFYELSFLNTSAEAERISGLRREDIHQKVCLRDAVSFPETRHQVKRTYVNYFSSVWDQMRRVGDAPGSVLVRPE